MKLILVSLISWVSGVAVISATSYLVYDELSSADFMGFAGMTLAGSLLLIGALYGPGLFWLRRRLGGCRPAALFPLATALFLNAPLFMIIALLAGRKMLSSEALLFALGFFTVGATFGLAFARAYREKAS